MRLTGVDIPEKHNTSSVDVCCMCGSITVAGIYEMRDPVTVTYQNEDDVEEDPTCFLFNMNPDADSGDWL